MKFLIRSSLDTLSGYGNDGVGLARALSQAGHDVHLYPHTVTPPIPAEVAQLLTKYPDAPFDVCIVHQSPQDLSGFTVRRAAYRMLAWTMWEFEDYRNLSDNPEFEPDYVRKEVARSEYDHLLCYDDVTASSVVPLFPDTVPHSILQGGYDPDFWTEVNPRARDWSGTFRFGMVGRLHRRKQPWAAVFAFGRLKDRYGDDFDAELHLKTTVAQIVPPQVSERWPGIKVHLVWWDARKLRDFYADMHCYVAPSIGEGKNLPALEAQTTGVPVIASEYGGHRNWLGEWAYPLKVSPKEWPEGRACEPDVDHLAELMWHVYTHREEAREKGMLARQVIPQMCSWSVVVERLADTCNRIEPRWVEGGGQHGQLVRAGVEDPGSLPSRGVPIARGGPAGDEPGGTGLLPVARGEDTPV